MTAYRDKLNAGEYAAKAEPEPEPATRKPASPAKDVIKQSTTQATTTRSSATRRRRRG